MRDFNFFYLCLQNFFIEAFLFLIILFLGLSTLKKIQPLLVEIELPQFSKGPFSQFVIYFSLATIFLLLTIYFLKSKKKKRILFKFVFLLAVFFGSLSLFLFWLPPIFALLLILIIISWWIKRPSVLNHDILMIFGISGVSTILSLSFSPEIFVYLLIIFSVYDILAVYKTKHMVKIAKEMMEHQAILGFIVPKKFRGLKERLEKVTPGGEFLILGGGDLAFPIIFCLTLFPKGIWASIIVAIFSLIGFFANNLILFSQKERKPMPALPLISFFSIIGYLITLFL